MERIVKLYQSWVGSAPLSVEPLPGAGSNRRYFRVQGGEPLQARFHTAAVIAVIGTNVEENRAFVTLSRFFGEANLPVPEVYAVSEDGMVYLQQDLGAHSLYDCIASGRSNGGCYSDEEVEAVCKAIRLLPSFQFLPLRSGRTDIFDCCFPQREMDRASVMFDLNYFKYCFLKLRGVEFNEYRLQEDFEHLAAALVGDTADTFLYRDFQSRNVMLKDGQPFFIDFQGGRRGPIYYDVASFLWQSSAKFSESLRNQLIDVYLEALQPYSQVARETFLAKLQLFVIFRILQVLGAYGYRGLWERKTYFINSIPLAINNLKQELSQGTCDAYPDLKAVCQVLIVQNEEEQRVLAEEAEKKGKVAAYLQNDQSYLAEKKSPLVVQVYSFSFKKGIPADDSGNGGGYVFDCRSTHNPGRYDEYKPLTGLDQPVIDFLEADGEILTFLESVYKLVDFHVARFMQRGFTHLQLSFGCTGGRHRSVYSAQHVAEHLHEKYGVEVHICHREQGITQVLSNQ